MLKAVIKHKHFSAQLLQGPFAGGKAIGIGNDRGNPQEIPGQEKRFIPSFALIRQQFRSIGHNYLSLKIGSAVSTR